MTIATCMVHLPCLFVDSLALSDHLSETGLSRSDASTMLPTLARSSPDRVGSLLREHSTELRTLLARHARPDMTTAIDGVLISKVERSSPPSPSMSGTVLALIAQGAKRLALGDRVYDYRAGQYLVASVDLPVTGHFIEASPSTRRWASGWSCARPPSPSCCCRQAPRTCRPRAGGAPSGHRRQRRPRRAASTPRSACSACSTSPATPRCWPR